MPSSGFEAYKSIEPLGETKIQRDREDTHSAYVLPNPRHSGEGRNPDGWLSRPFARVKTIEGWMRAWKVEMIENGNWGWWNRMKV